MNTLRPVLHLLLAALLLLFVGSPAAAENHRPKDATPVRFLMHNVEDYFVAGEQQRSRYTIHPKPETSREAVADVIASAKPDIIGLIEIGGKQALDDLRQRLAARGLEYPHSRVLPRRGEERALALLSRYPITEDNSRADYPLYGQQRRNMLRGILDVTVKHADGRSFRILGVHLKSHVAKDEAAATSLRTREAETLSLHVGAALKEQPNARLLIFGDWNDNPEENSLASLHKIKGKGGKPALTRLSPADSRGERRTLFYRGGKPTCVYDQIYVNTPLLKRMGKEAASGIVDIPNARRGSAHRALWCELR